MLSILITCYNQSEIVIKIIDKILLTCSNLNIEIIVSDDYSTDDSFKTLTNYYKSNNLVKIVQPEINLGVSNNRNNLIKHASMKYSIFIDGDDIQTDDYITTIYNHLEDDDIYYIKSFTEIWSDSKQVVKYSDRYDNVFLYVFKTEKVKGKYFDKDLTIGEDVEFCTRYYDYIESGDKTIDVSYQLNRREDNISLTKNGDIEERFKRDKILLDYIIKYEHNCPNKLSGKINQKKIDVLNQAILLDKQFDAGKINTKHVSNKHKLSYILYLCLKTIKLLFIYKFLLQKFIGYKM